MGGLLRYGCWVATVSACAYKICIIRKIRYNPWSLIQHQPEGSTLANLAPLDEQATLVIIFDNAAGQRQAQAPAALFGGITG